MPNVNQFRLTLFLLVVVALFVLAAIVVNRATILVSYHDWQMGRAHERAYADPIVHPNGLVSLEVDGDFEQYEHHRDCLVDLGALCRIDYEFQQVMAPTPKSRALLSLLRDQKSPAYIDFISTHPRSLKPLQITIWCRPNDLPTWQAFLAAQDRGDR